MADTRKSIPLVRKHKRQAPLTDLGTLNNIGRTASRKAQKRAFDSTGSITVAKDGYVTQIDASGKETKKRKIISQENFPTLQNDLCLD